MQEKRKVGRPKRKDPVFPEVLHEEITVEHNNDNDYGKIVVEEAKEGGPGIPDKPTIIEDQVYYPDTYILEVEGFIPKVKKALEELPKGHIPIEVVYEEANLRKFGLMTYLFVIWTNCPDKRCTIIGATGIKELKKNLQEAITAIGGKPMVKVLDHRVNKRTMLRQYLAIIVK